MGATSGRTTGRAPRLAVAVAVSLTLVFAACGGPAGESPTSAPPTPPATATSGPTPTAAAGPDIVMLDANVLTMHDPRPRAEAVAIDGDLIVAVGTNAEVEALVGSATVVVRLGGLTLTPGFIDAHQHRLGDGPGRLGLSQAELIEAAVSQGWTGIQELYVDQGRLDELQTLDASGVLRLRVDAYLPVQENSAEGTLFDEYYAAYSPGQQVSPRVRVAGLKLFTDFDNANILLWRQADLDTFVLERHREGWQLAVKTVAANSLAMIITAFESVRAVEPSVVEARGRLEHMLFATPEQIAALGGLGLVPAINLNMPGQGVGDGGIDDLVARQPGGSYVPWRSLFEAELPAAGISGFPSYHVDEPSGAPFGSPIHLIYQAVTRVGNHGVPSPEALLGQAISAEDALRSLTRNAAFAAFADDLRGSLASGMLADLVILSDDPLAVDTEAINDIEVVGTIIGGQLEFCAAGFESVCPRPGS